jgi:hypothetical protein
MQRVDEGNRAFAAQLQSESQTSILRCGRWWTLVYGAFSKDTKATWSEYDTGEWLESVHDFPALWDWVVNPFTRVVGLLGARNIIRSRIATTSNHLERNAEV